jgi:hypothetical protein
MSQEIDFLAVEMESFAPFLCTGSGMDRGTDSRTESGSKNSLDYVSCVYAIVFAASCATELCDLFASFAVALIG